MLLKKKLFTIFFLFLSPIVLKANEDVNSPSIIIIGAGASGISAAAKLFENGFKNIKILEAEDRIGGRVYTTPFGGYLVDLGGQWVHGEVDNVAFELAWPLGLLERGNIMNRSNKLFDSSGAKIDQSLANEFYEFYKEAGERMTEFSEKNRNVSVGSFYKNEIDKYFATHPVWKENEVGLLNLLDMAEMAQAASDSWWNVSASSDVEFYESSGDYLINWKERGYSTILDILMKRYPNPKEELPVMNNTILNAEVTSIDYTDKNGKVTVKTTKGETYSADHVIVTCSLGVLKDKHNSLFQPNLSEEKQKTIEALGFGGVGKVYFSFEEPWWPNETLGVGLTLLWKDEDLKMLQNDPQKSWLQGLVGFMSVENKPRLLYAWISGKHSLEMEKLSEEQVLNHSLEVLHKFFGNTYNVTSPTGMKRTMWNTNNHFKGTYSHRSVKTETENVYPATLAKPIGDSKPTILFAGEATNPHHFSTVHGAIETGWREAERIIKHYPNLGQIETSTPPSA